MSTLLWILLYNLLLSHGLEAYKALVVVPLPSKSHSILGNSLVDLLADAGNDVTYITSFPRNKSSPGVTEIAVDINRKLWTDGLNLTALLRGDTSLYNIKAFLRRVSDIDSQTIHNKDVQMLMNDPNIKFDVIIVHWMYSDVYAGLAHVFDCPLVWLSSMSPHWEILRLIDAIPSPNHFGDIFSTNQPPIGFLQRVYELKLRISSMFFIYSYASPMQNTQYQNIIAPSILKRGKVVPNFEELRFNASLILGNSHISLTTATDVPENYKSVAGFHIPKHLKPLTEDLKQILDNADHGVIYFSLGSNIQSESFPVHVRDGLLKMFGQLKQTVLWKFEEDIPHKPANVHIVHWAPQHSILAHQNCILFITHGGFLSVVEAVRFGKPLIGIPVFGDQFSNVARAVIKGFAKKVDLSYKIADELFEAIQDILNNPSYDVRAKELSFIYSHRTASPAAEVVHWVDHVVKTRGALHLRSPAVQLYWYQKMYFDLFTLILVTILGLKILITGICIRLFGKNGSQKKKEN